MGGENNLLSMFGAAIACGQQARRSSASVAVRLEAASRRAALRRRRPRMSLNINRGLTPQRNGGDGAAVGQRGQRNILRPRASQLRASSAVIKILPIGSRRRRVFWHHRIT